MEELIRFIARVLASSDLVDLAETEVIFDEIVKLVRGKKHGATALALITYLDYISEDFEKFAAVQTANRLVGK